MSNTRSGKYSFEPQKIEKESSARNLFRMKCDFHRVIKVKKDAGENKIMQEKTDRRKQNKLREPLGIQEKVLILE